jgi:predicted small integral membrane protein
MKNRKGDNILAGLFAFAGIVLLIAGIASHNLFGGLLMMIIYFLGAASCILT